MNHNGTLRHQLKLLNAEYKMGCYCKVHVCPQYRYTSKNCFLQYSCLMSPSITIKFLDIRVFKSVQRNVEPTYLHANTIVCVVTKYS